MHLQTALPRQHIVSIFQAGVAAADPTLAIQQCLSTNGKQLRLHLELRDTEQFRVGDWQNIHLLAFGKAACAMIAAAQKIIPADKLAGKGIAVTSYENVRSITDIEVIGAGHPLPDANGWQAGKIIAERVSRAQAGELVLALISGGGSALLPAPVEGISLAEKITTTNLLLACGANINEINCVRKHLSQLKGGGLAKLAAPADLHAMILSDVLGDDLSAIASGPTVPDDSRFCDAIAVLKSYQVWQATPAAVKTYLQQGEQNLHPETPKSGAAIFQNSSHTLIGSNAISLAAAQQTGAKLAYPIKIYSRHLCGEARLAAEKLAQFAKNLQTNGLNQPIAILAGGETTVTLSGNGKGGRNQEMALAFALAAEQQQLSGDWTFLSGGTDGRDGPTDAAGGIVDTGSLLRIRRAGFDPLAMLNRHDSYPALQAANDLLITGATGTNVADLQILLLHPASE